MGVSGGPYIVRDSSLVLELDAADRNSYPGSGTTWTDLTANNNNGTLTNGPTFSSTNGGSIVFDGVDDYASINNTVGNFGTSDFTINFFFKTTEPTFPSTFIAKSIGDNPTSDYGWLVNNGSNGTNLGFGIASVNGSWGANGSYSIQTSGANIRNGLWQMATVVGIRTQSNVSIYLNAVTQTLQSYVGAASFATVGNVSNARTLCIASESDVSISPYPIEANISIVQIYNRALSASEILQNYNAQKSRFNL
jgi:hypothetical protein